MIVLKCDPKLSIWLRSNPIRAPSNCDRIDVVTSGKPHLAPWPLVPKRHRDEADAAGLPRDRAGAKS